MFGSLSAPKVPVSTAPDTRDFSQKDDETRISPIKNRLLMDRTVGTIEVQSETIKSRKLSFDPRSIRVIRVWFLERNQPS